MVALIADHDHQIVELWGAWVVVFARWIETPLQDIVWDHERSGDRSVLGDLRVASDVDQGCARADRLECSGWIESLQAPTCVREKLMDRPPSHCSPKVRPSGITEPAGPARLLRFMT